MPYINLNYEMILLEYGVILELVSIGRQFQSIQSMKDWGDNMPCLYLFPRFQWM